MKFTFNRLEKFIYFVLVCFLFLILLVYSDLSAKQIVSPEEFLGFKVGADFKYAEWDKITGYFSILDKSSNRIKVETFGSTTMGKEMIAVVISDSSTIADLNLHKLNQKKIADPRLIKDDKEKEYLIYQSKPVVFLNMQIHSTEAAASQMSMELAYDLVTGKDSIIKEILERIIIVMIPCANPDGLNLVSDYYKKTLGTPWEGGRMPWLYQKYAGHDNNRDWYMLNLKETQEETKYIYEQWPPTVLWDIHQTRKNSYRLFLPPFHDPKNPNNHPLIERMLYAVGGFMASELSSEGKTGVVHGVSYDNYWAGGFRTTPHRHNILGLLSEGASVNFASPIFWEKQDLVAPGKGLDKYAPAVNFPDPWPGGWWRLRDLVDYEKSAAMALFKFAARFHDVLQKNYIKMGVDAINKGKNEPPFAWIIPADQKDPGSAYEMLKRLKAAGIEMHQADESFTADGIKFGKGSFIMYCAQPYRPYLMDMMERQHYPDKSIYPGGPAEPPYDAAAWTFPLLMGVDYRGIEKSFKCREHKINDVPRPVCVVKNIKKSYFVINPGVNDNFRLINRLINNKIDFFVYTGEKVEYLHGLGIMPGAVIIKSSYSRIKKSLNGLCVRLSGVSKPPNNILNKCRNIKNIRIALYQPWTASMDEGWTRYVLDSFEYSYNIIHNQDIKFNNLNKMFDCIILPSIRGKTIIKGNSPESSFPEYVGGIGIEGVNNLQEFVQNGGTLVCIDQSTDIPVEYFNIPVKNILKSKKENGFYCPGSILRLSIDNSHPLGYGMDKWYQGYFKNSQAFDVELEGIDEKINRNNHSLTPEKRVHVVSEYSDSNILESGWIRHPEKIKGKPAIIEIKYGDGNIDLIGIRVQNRAQTHGTFKILFNAIMRSVYNR